MTMRWKAIIKLGKVVNTIILYLLLTSSSFFANSHASKSVDIELTNSLLYFREAPVHFAQRSYQSFQTIQYDEYYNDNEYYDEDEYYNEDEYYDDDESYDDDEYYDNDDEYYDDDDEYDDDESYGDDDEYYDDEYDDEYDGRNPRSNDRQTVYDLPDLLQPEKPTPRLFFRIMVGGAFYLTSEYKVDTSYSNNITREGTSVTVGLSDLSSLQSGGNSLFNVHLGLHVADIVALYFAGMTSIFIFDKLSYKYTLSLEADGESVEEENTFTQSENTARVLTGVGSGMSIFLPKDFFLMFNGYASLLFASKFTLGGIGEVGIGKEFFASKNVALGFSIVYQFHYLPNVTSSFQEEITSENIETDPFDQINHVIGVLFSISVH